MREPRSARFPGVVLIDNREQQPYAFDRFTADKKFGGGPLVVETRTVCLNTGDYSVEGFEERIAVERKSLNDLFHTLSQGRDRFERELTRLNGFEVAAVVVEAEWATILGEPPRFSQLEPKTVYRSVLAWCQRFPRVHWYTVPGREFGEATALRILERFVRDRQRQTRQKDNR